MTTHEDDLLQRCLDRLRELPFVDEATLVERQGGEAGRRFDGKVRIKTPGKTEVLVVEVKRTHLTRTVVEGVLAQAAALGSRPWILFAPHVGRPLGRFLDEHGTNFVDPAGNCRLKVGRQHIAKIEGRPPEPRPRHGRGVGAPGLQVNFALLARPDLVNKPVRVLAAEAGVGTATAANRINELCGQGLVHETTRGKRLTEPHRLMDAWVKGYEVIVRPRLLIGRFRTRDDDPEALEQTIEEALGDHQPWGFGGGAAAYRLTGHYRGTDTVVHIGTGDERLVRALRALKAEDGPLTLLRAPGPTAFKGEKPHTVAPLLVFTELLFAHDKRAREAAAEIQRKYLRLVDEPVA